jgi:hypothetical protein
VPAAMESLRSTVRQIEGLQKFEALLGKLISH